mmetsp:Transcript_36927/g.98383  ORF Transcript_36927/g.98383 Transcript_36927/m.98383 type:complete len:191 (-) Transcript_36927:81-653(-)
MLDGDNPGSSGGNYFKMARDTMEGVNTWIEATPRRFSAVCFAGGVIGVVVGVYLIITELVHIDVTTFLVAVYIFVFAVVTCVSELHPHFIGMGETLPSKVESLQHSLHDWMKAITLIWGRGLFYIFQGALICHSPVPHLLGFIAGIYVMLTGVGCIYLHFLRQYRVYQAKREVASVVGAGARETNSAPAW